MWQGSLLKGFRLPFVQRGRLKGFVCRRLGSDLMDFVKYENIRS